MAITIGSRPSKLKYGTNGLVNDTNTGIIIAPIMEFFVFSFPKIIKLRIINPILIININFDGSIYFCNTIDNPVIPIQTKLYCKKNTLNANATIKHPINNQKYLLTIFFLSTCRIILFNFLSLNSFKNIFLTPYSMIYKLINCTI